MHINEQSKSINKQDWTASYTQCCHLTMIQLYATKNKTQTYTHTKM